MSRGLLDITLALGPDTPTWENSPGVRRYLAKSTDQGDASNDSVLELDCHAGTHVDAPFHVLPQGRGAESLDLDALCGPASLRDLRGVRAVGAADLSGLDLPRDCTRLLLRTDNTRDDLYSRPFTRDFCGLDESGAAWCVERGLALLGVDYLSVARYEEGGPVHHALLAAGTILLEGLDLSDAPEGEHELYCLPLKLVGADGAPARCLLRLGAE